MTLLRDIRRFFTRRSPAVINLAPSGRDAGPEHSDRSLSVQTGPAIGVARHNLDPLDEIDGNSAPASGDVARAVQRISELLGRSSEQASRLVGLLEKIPGSLDGLPEVNRQTSRLLEVVSDQVESSRRREETLLAALSRINDTAKEHGDVLGQVGQQLETSQQASVALGENIHALRLALTDLAESNSRTVGALSHLTKANQARDQDLLMMVRRMQWWLVGAVVICGLLTAGAIVVELVLRSN